MGLRPVTRVLALVCKEGCDFKYQNDSFGGRIGGIGDTIAEWYFKHDGGTEAITRGMRVE
jgi:hypothetical protein